MKKVFYVLGLIVLISLSLVLNSCEEEVDLLAPYKSTPVIFGILDFTADTQFVRINRTYLGEGDATQYASIRDSVEYDPSEVDAWLIKKVLENEEFQVYDIIDSIKLEPIVLPSRDPGIFYNQDVVFYHTTEPLFTAAELAVLTNPSPNANNFYYEIRATIRGEVYRGQTDFPTISETDIIQPFPIGTPGAPRQQYFLPSGNGGTYNNISFTYQNRNRARRYQSTHRIIYNYNLSDGTLVTDQIADFELGVRSADRLNETSAVTFNSESIYEFLGNIALSNPDIQKVRIKSFQFKLTAASSSLDTYIEVANPVSDFTPVLSSYTNLNNGAIGLIGARGTAIREFYINDASLTRFNSDPLTIDEDGNPCYCVELPWDGTNFNCTDTQENCP